MGEEIIIGWRFTPDGCAAGDLELLLVCVFKLFQHI